MNTSMKSFLLATLVSLGLFLVLPYPFTVSRISCSQNRTTGISDCATTKQIEWSWFGGYHATLERTLPMSSESKESQASKYYGITRGGVLKLAVISVILGSVSCLAYLRIRAARVSE